VSYLVILGAAFVAGAINSVAGGGTLLSFPALVWVGLPSTIANATSAAAIWPGSLGALWGYRRDLDGIQPQTYLLTVPSVIGSVIGAVLLALTPTSVFDRIIPLLIFFATVLFMLQEPVQRLVKTSGQAHAASTRWLMGALVFQLLVAIYGGYFGAGMGILMLAAFGIMGFTDIHQMNGLKNFLSLCINGVATVYFVWQGMVQWPYALVMAVGAIAGGIWGAALARRVGPRAVRRTVIVVGFSMAISLLFRL
jgi:uncharacterized membrane protein YfcA